MLPATVIALFSSRGRGCGTEAREARKASMRASSAPVRSHILDLRRHCARHPRADACVTASEGAWGTQCPSA